MSKMQISLTNEIVQEKFLVLQNQLSEIVSTCNEGSLISTGKNIMWRILQILSCLIGAAIILITIILPTELLSFTEQVNKNTTIYLTIHNDNVTMAVYLIKSLMVLLSILFVITGMLISSIVRRNKRYRKLSNDVINLSKNIYAPTNS